MTPHDYFAEQVRRASVASFYRRLAARFHDDAQKAGAGPVADDCRWAAVRLNRAANAEMTNRPPDGLQA